MAALHSLTDRENARRIIAFDKPQRIVPRVPAYMLKYQGVDHEEYTGPGDDHALGSTWFDIWGVGWRKEMDGVMGLTCFNPLSTVHSLASYRWPDPDDERICGRIHAMVSDFPGGDLFLGGSHRDTLWEKAYMLVGMENLMLYFHTEPGFVREVLRHIMDFQLGIARHYAQAGVEYAALGDDLGTQIGPLISPRTVQEFLVPEYRRLFAFYGGRGTIIEFHSCGRIDWMLETFIGLGVDILNPLQATANDLAAVRAATQGRLALAGAVSSGLVMEGPPERIVAEARCCMRLLGREGGYFCRTDQSLPYPQAHSDALAEAIAEYGRYPPAPIE